MAKLTADEEKLLKKLTQKREAPDPGPIGRAINVSIDLGDEKQVERARRLGLLDGFDDEDEQEDTEEEGEEEADDTPKRRGYFGES